MTTEETKTEPTDSPNAENDSILRMEGKKEDDVNVSNLTLRDSKINTGYKGASSFG